MTPFVTREAWGARPARSRPATIRPGHLTAHYGGPSPWPGPGRFDHARCASIVRGYQAFHMDRNGWADVAYSSLVCPHGFRFEGRGPGARTAANGTNAGNGASLATCYVAGEGDPLTDEARLAFLDEAARFGLPLDRVHSDWFSTSCPGSPLRAWVKAGAPRPGGASPIPPPAPPAPTPTPPAPPARTQEGPVFLIAEGIGIFAVVDGIIAGFPDLVTYSRARDRSPSVPVLHVEEATGRPLVEGLLLRQAARP